MSRATAWGVLGALWAVAIALGVWVLSDNTGRIDGRGLAAVALAAVALWVNDRTEHRR